jgi:hypothetical protein
MSFLARLHSPEKLVAVELRPPRSDLDPGASMDSWFATNAALRRVATPDRIVFLTDNAAGSPEEENLHHVITNLEENVPRGLLAPFLTTKHDLEYCLWFAARAVEARFPALVVLGGDRHVGPPRCVAHGNELRVRIRERHPDLALGGWANPHADPHRQVDFLLAEDHAADFFLTQVVSHHDLRPLERFLSVARERGVELPGVVGVFFWRSANPTTLRFLERFFPVPAAGLARDFERGLSPEEICATTIRALRDLGVGRVYISNLNTERAPEHLAAIEARL